MKTINSNRVYHIIGIENGQSFDVNYTLEDIFSESNDTELIYSLQDEADKIMDLKPGEGFQSYCNRDNKTILNAIIIIRK